MAELTSVAGITTKRRQVPQNCCKAKPEDFAAQKLTQAVRRKSPAHGSRA